MGVYLGVDIGTSGTKTLAIQEDGTILASATEEYPLSNPKPGWSEQEPDHWWKATIDSINAVMKAGKIKPDDVKGIGLSGQMHGSVFLNKKNEVIRPALLWNDQRTAAECDEIEKLAGGRKKLIQMVANPALTGFTAPKILWLRNNEPKNFEKTTQVLLPKDYVRFRLTGEFATEVSDASGTLLLNVKKRNWSKKLLGKLDLSRDLLPKVFESEEVSGELTTESAKLLGLNSGTPVVGGGGDQAASAIGNGIVRKELSRPRWGQVVSSSRIVMRFNTIPAVECIPSVTRSATNGTSWESSCRRVVHCNGIAINCVRMKLLRRRNRKSILTN